MSEPCNDCASAFKTEKKLRLEGEYTTKSTEGSTLARDNGVSGFFIALSKNETSYMVQLQIPEGSKLNWSYISIL